MRHSKLAKGEGVRVGEWEVSAEELQVSVVGKEGFAVAQDAGYTVIVDRRLTPELADEGLARELVHRIQTMRRNAGFDIADRIVAHYDGDDDVRRVMLPGKQGDYVRQETLSRELVEGEPPPGAHIEEHTVDGRSVRLAVQRVEGA